MTEIERLREIQKTNEISEEKLEQLAKNCLNVSAFWVFHFIKFNSLRDEHLLNIKLKSLTFSHVNLSPNSIFDKLSFPTLSIIFDLE